MNSKKIAIVALGLWVITIGIIAFLFIQGQTKPLPDNRVEVQVSESERAFILSQMRQFVEATKGIVEGINHNKVDLIRNGSRIGGKSAESKEPASLKLKIPIQWKKLGKRLHNGFDGLTEAAEKGASKEELLNMLSDHLGTCVSCHNVFRLKREKE